MASALRSVASGITKGRHEVDVNLVVEILDIVAWYLHEAVFVVQKELVNLYVGQVLVHVRLEGIPQVPHFDQAVRSPLGEGLEGLGDVVRRVLDLDLLRHGLAELAEIDAPPM